ncbi:cytochrome P450 monooxygenase pc-2 [Epithele typhae]|uniref:cytochrome P450 monooxygenase pc-2 n=1 Tax=Epithele typhae TaxID=378194 RepID=UPI002008DCCB|nr:cytochrome P450 monooxygenase pc-2 [Epithele typhae]KAH9927188.1 cytochrome P450 monooxygenase pc-2 [Epithele typhae]
MPPTLPPGLQQSSLKALVVNLVAPAAAVLTVHRVLAALGLDFHLRFGVVVLLAVLSVPATFAARVQLNAWSVRRRARRAGAVLPPRWDGKRIGNFDILAHALERSQNGYIGEGVWDRIEELNNLYEIDLVWTPLYFTADVNVIKTLLATGFEHFEKGPTLRETLDTLLGTGVFNSDGEMWKWHRTMTRPYFSRDRISHFEIFGRHADFAIKKMQDRFCEGRALDFQALSRFTLDSASEFLFGTNVNSLQTDLPYAHNDPKVALYAREIFSEAFLGAQNAIVTRLRIGSLWRFNEFFKDAAAEHMHIIDQFLKPILEAAIKKRNQTKLAGLDASTEEQEDETLLGNLVKITDDPKVLRDETLNILLAGRDTTATTLTFVVYMLCLYPEVLKRLRAEILDHIGPNAMPTFDDIRTMKYLRAVLNETLRLFPPVPLNIRVANQDTTVPNPNSNKPPIFVPKGVGVAYSVLHMHRREDLWGPDALEFDPDRFLDDRLNKYFTKNPMIFLPFNAGPRICLGQQFAYNESSFFLIRLLQSFSDMELDLAAQPPSAFPPAEWAHCEGQKGREKVRAKAHLTTYVEGGLWVKMSERDLTCNV